MCEVVVGRRSGVWVKSDLFGPYIVCAFRYDAKAVRLAGGLWRR